MKVLFLPKYGMLAASARQRFFQYVPYLAQSGLSCTVSPLLDDDYLQATLSGRRAPARAVLAGLWRRLGAVLSAGRYDLAVLHYEAVPYLPPLVEHLLAARVPYVCDYDDAIFHNYDQHRSALVRGLLGQKIARVMARSRGVLCGSSYLQSYAARVQPRTLLLPTVVDLSAYPKEPPLHASSRHAFTIGWIGSPSTAPYLHALQPVLQALGSEGPLRLLCVGSGPLRLEGVPIEIRPFREDREVADLQEMDVGVMPLSDTPWSRGKCGFKLIQYMASSLPVVASPVGANREIVPGGARAPGFLAADPSEWLQALRRLRDDAALRRSMGKEGRALVERHYCLAVAAPQLRDFLVETTRSAPQGGASEKDALSWSQGASP